MSKKIYTFQGTLDHDHVLNYRRPSTFYCWNAEVDEKNAEERVDEASGYNGRFKCNFVGNHRSSYFLKDEVMLTNKSILPEKQRIIRKQVGRTGEKNQSIESNMAKNTIESFCKRKSVRCTEKRRGSHVTQCREKTLLRQETEKEMKEQRL